MQGRDRNLQGGIINTKAFLKHHIWKPTNIEISSIYIHTFIERILVTLPYNGVTTHALYSTE